MRRVVVTGMGINCPLGNNINQVYDALAKNQSGINIMHGWKDISCLRCHVAGIVSGIDPKRIPRKFRRTMGRVAILAAFAAQQAVKNANLDSSLLASPQTGIAMGSTIGSAAILEEFFGQYIAKHGFDEISGTTFMKVMSHTVAANIAALLGIRGQMLTLCSACSSATQAIGAGYNAIKHGEQQIMICGGADDLHPTTAGVFDVVSAASTHYNDNPCKTPRPFDADRDGLALSEAAGVIVLEELEHARNRSANIYGEILAYATSCNAHHMTQPDSESMLNCMQLAVQNAKLNITDIDYINAHATATLAGDAAEAQAVRQFASNIPISSTKGHLGHTMAACGAIEAMLCLEMIRNQQIVPTKNLDNVADDCQGIAHVRELAFASLNRVLSSNFAFGGVSASLVLGKL